MRSRITSIAGALCLTWSIACAPPACAIEYRSIDGTGNNLANPSWGAAGSELLRMSQADYRGDTLYGASIDDRGRLSPRVISNLLSLQTSSAPNSRGMTSGTWQWGQFLDHDIDLTPSSSDSAEMSMMMSPGDPYGVTMIPFSRSVHNLDSSNERQQVNQITSYIDASNVYGSNATRAAALREFSGGRMRTSGGGLLMPTSDMAGMNGLDNANEGPENVLFVGGDVRANEQLGLIAMHTLFVREHNRLADGLAAYHQGDSAWDDERLYQTARRIVGAEIQAITYNEFLPAMLGSYAPSAADFSYNAGVNASIANEFSTALFRVGHTMLNSQLMLSGDGGQDLGSISLDQAFFSPSQVISRPKLMEEVLMGLTSQQAMEIDTRVVDEVRNFLFAPNGSMGLDLAALNLQRGRDHGLPDYNTLREAYGLPRADAFSDITSDTSLQLLLAQAYDSVGNIDPWIGALAEDHVGDASVGLLLATALGDQFSRLRDGDRFFYMGDALLNSPDILSLVDFSNVNMMNLLAWNTDMKDMPQSFFMAVPEPAGLALLALAGLTALCRRR